MASSDLSKASRERRVAPRAGNRSGDASLWAGVPAGSRVADKTATGSHGTANDVAAPGRPDATRSRSS